jgi:hypothetical protein
VTIRLALPPGNARTLYDRLGQYVPYTAAGVSAIAAIAGLIRIRRSRKAQPAAPTHHVAAIKSKPVPKPTRPTSRPQ